MTNPNRRPALGRGLSALMGDVVTPPPEKATPNTLPIVQVHPARDQPRLRMREEGLAELVESIRANGIIQPVVVRRLDTENYQIIAGERRWRAAQAAGLTDIPVAIRDATDAEAYELALVENIQREDLDPIEEAEAYRHLVDHLKISHEDLAQRVGKDRATISNALRLLRMPRSLQEDIVDGALTAGHARAILVAPDTDTQINLANRAKSDGWSVRETERQARATRQPAEPPEKSSADPAAPRPPAPPPRSPANEAVEAQLRAALGAPVRLVHRAGRGRIEIRFHSLEELERLLELVTSLEGR